MYCCSFLGLICFGFDCIRLLFLSILFLFFFIINKWIENTHTHSVVCAKYDSRELGVTSEWEERTRSTECRCFSINDDAVNDVCKMLCCQTETHYTLFSLFISAWICLRFSNPLKKYTQRHTQNVARIGWHKLPLNIYYIRARVCVVFFFYILSNALCFLFSVLFIFCSQSLCEMVYSVYLFFHGNYTNRRSNHNHEWSVKCTSISMNSTNDLNGNEKKRSNNNKREIFFSAFFFATIVIYIHAQWMCTLFFIILLTIQISQPLCYFFLASSFFLGSFICFFAYSFV